MNGQGKDEKVMEDMKNTARDNGVRICSLKKNHMYDLVMLSNKK